MCRPVALLAVSAMSSSAVSHAKILGANDRIDVAVMGMGGRGRRLAVDFAKAAGTAVTHVCDPDYRRCDQANEVLAEASFAAASKHSDVRKMLESSDADVSCPRRQQQVCLQRKFW